MKKHLAVFGDLTAFERCLWLGSVIAVTLSFVLFSDDYMTLAASLIGVTALIFVAKGYVLGQVLTVVFALFYGYISYFQAYYGEMITYLGMTAPIAAMAVWSWVTHPYKKTKQVKVHRMKTKELVLMGIFALLVTVLFYYILQWMGNANLAVSTLSVTTSFLASYLTFMRSPYYGLGYAANDVVLIILWVSSTLKDISYLPMVVCFVCFFMNDVYGFLNWRSIQRHQSKKRG